jgi:hypothetical protein
MFSNKNNKQNSIFFEKFQNKIFEIFQNVQSKDPVSLNFSKVNEKTGISSFSESIIDPLKLKNNLNSENKKQIPSFLNQTKST